MTVNDDSTRGEDTGRSGDTAVADNGAVVSTMPASRVAGVVRVNLLPPELGEVRALRKVQLGAAAAVAVAAALVGVLYYQQAHNLDDAQDALAKAQAQNTRLQAEQARLGNVDALFKQVDAADAMLASASAYEIHMSNFLDELSLRQPQNIYYSQVTISETPGGIPLPGAVAAPAAGAVVPGAATTTSSLGTISVTGVGFTHTDVAAWLDAFAQMTGVTNVYLTGSTEALIGDAKGAQVPTVNWTTTAQLSLAALAGQNPDGSGSK